MVMLQWTKVAVVLNCVKSYSKYGLVVGTRKHDHETHKRWGIYEAAARLLAFQEDTFCVELVYQTLVGVWCLFRLWLSGLWHLLSFVTVVPENVLMHFRNDIPTSRTLEVFYQTTRCHYPGDHYLRSLPLREPELSHRNLVMFTGSGLRCWSCTSNGDTNCADPFNRNVYNLQDCEYGRSSHPYTQFSTAVCKKQKQSGTYSFLLNSTSALEL
jgi:hypothetical protein